MYNFTSLPQEARDSCIQGVVIVKFQIKPDGTVDSLETLHSVHPVLDQHAYNFIFQTNGRWNAGTIDGVPTSMKQTILFVYGNFDVENVQNYVLAGIPWNEFIFGYHQQCPDAADFYKKGMKAYKKELFQEAWRYFDQAHRRNFLDLDALHMLKKTSDQLGIEFDICKGLALISRYSNKEIRRVRDPYCTKNFQQL
jgi:TonB family protein